MAKKNSCSENTVGCTGLVSIIILIITFIKGGIFCFFLTLSMILLPFIAYCVYAGWTERTKKCNVCDCEIIKTSYSWDFDGKKILLCPFCNSNFKKAESDEKCKEWKNKKKEN